jgi:NAD+ kinase
VAGLVEKTMTHIGLYVNVDHPRAAEAVRRLAACAAAQGVKLVAWGETASFLKRLNHPFLQGKATEADALLVLGGDGTMLRAVRETITARRPVMGVNMGSLGFLTGVSEQELDHAVACLARGAVIESPRTLAEVQVFRQGRPLERALCLNDVVVRNGDSARIVTLEIRVDEGTAAPITGDGIIIATPTGSTGHSLSAGGPILHPACPAFVATFICAHALAARPLVIPDSSTITLRIVHCAGEVRLIADGQSALALEAGDEVRVIKAAEAARFIYPPEHDFLGILRAKLRWQGSSV